MKDLKNEELYGTVSKLNTNPYHYSNDIEYLTKGVQILNSWSTAIFGGHCVTVS